MNELFHTFSSFVCDCGSLQTKPVYLVAAKMREKKINAGWDVDCRIASLKVNPISKHTWGPIFCNLNFVPKLCTSFHYLIKIHPKVTHLHTHSVAAIRSFICNFRAKIIGIIIVRASRQKSSCLLERIYTGQWTRQP